METLPPKFIAVSDSCVVPYGDINGMSSGRGGGLEVLRPDGRPAPPLLLLLRTTSIGKNLNVETGKKSKMQDSHWIGPFSLTCDFSSHLNIQKIVIYIKVFALILT